MFGVCDPKDAKSEVSRKYTYYRFINIPFVDRIFQNHIYAEVITIQTVPQVSSFIMKTCAERFEMWKIEVSKVCALGEKKKSSFK